jgi:alpha-N-acetylglucosamine transferase
MFVVDGRLFQFSSNMILNITEPNDLGSSITSDRHPFTFAYAFYVTEYHYSCFTLINVYRLINELSIDDSVKIVLLVKKFIDKQTEKLVNKTVQLSPGRIQVVYLDPANTNLTSDRYYSQSYLKLEVFRQTQFRRYFNKQ